jgi:iron complex outermembrane receptor protein
VNTCKTVALAAVLILPPPGLADEADEIVVVGRTVETSAERVAVERELLIDTATALKEIPGANVNANGTLTGIAQYRGLYGDRVAVDLDHLGLITGGPNAMDTPLSYMSPMITEELVVSRGIASVSLAPESIGGHINTRLSRGDFAADGFAVSGMIGTRYVSNGDVSTSAGRLTLASENHRVSLIGEIDSGDDYATPAGTIRPSMLERDRYDLSYAYDDESRHFLLFAGLLDTGPTGTPALPMDILLIDTEMFGAQFDFEASSSVAIEGRVSWNDVYHEMDNYSLRQAPMPMSQRLNTATGEGSQFSVAATIELADSTLRIGTDGIDAKHASIITNPGNAMFRVDNFTNIGRDLVGLFAEWDRESGKHGIEAGIRIKRVRTDAGLVGASGMMGEMGSNVDMLANNFNESRRDLEWDTADAVFKYQNRVGPHLEWNVEAGVKSRAPSYQELYLWLPLQATGGLADGRSYIGNLELREERSREVVAGLSFDNSRFAISPQVYFKSIDDYIQGVPSTNMLANMVATMMTGQAPLQFDNVDARIWGADAAWRYVLTDRLLLDGIVSISRGRRADVDDNLYRLSPYSGSVGLTYDTGSWSFRTEVVGVADQDKVSAYNNESATSGYWLGNLAFAWATAAGVRVEARIDNLFDERYQDHVAGINRAGGSDIPIGIRLYGAERTVSAGLVYSF